MPFEFATATRIVFGRGSIDGLAPSVASLGRRALVVTGSDPARTGVFARLEDRSDSAERHTGNWCDRAETPRNPAETTEFFLLLSRKCTQETAT